MKDNFTPILVIPAIPYNEGIRFLHHKTQIDIAPEMAKTLWKILSFTNGHNDIAAIARLTSLPKDEISEIFFELYDLELVVDAREQFMHFHKVSNYPAIFNATLSQDEIETYTRSNRAPVKSGKIFKFELDNHSKLYPIRAKRRSCRNFSDFKLTINQIGSICHYAYSIYDHSVPSGGALYPLKLYVLVEKPQNGMNPGYYEYDAEKNTFICFNNEVDEEQLKYCFNCEKMPFSSSVQIVIAADLKRQPHKYANRGYRLTLIEIGHAAENISLYCAEQGFGACEMGGVLDEPLKTELELDENIWPILAIPVGYPANSDPEVFNKIRYVEENVGENHVVKELWAKAFAKNGSFFGAATTYKDANGNTHFAGATSPSYADAVFKATIEGYERWLSSQVRVDFHGSARELDKPWLDPRLIFPMTDGQCEKENLTPFSENLPINWTKGEFKDGSEIFIPSDIIYYGQKTEPNRIYLGHSSGIAAYSDYDEAKKRALTELIERDAIMRNWYTRKSPRIVEYNFLPIHAKKRIDHWAKNQRNMMILQMESDYGWVFETIITSNEYPCFISGAAATINPDEINSTITKSIQEAEYILLLTLENPDYSEINPQDVTSTTDHGKIYHFSTNAKKLKWLWGGNFEESFEDPKHLGLDQLLNILDVTTVDLSENNSTLKVVRVFSPKLVPINFGSNLAHFTHPALKGKVHPDSLEMPHYFA